MEAARSFLLKLRESRKDHAPEDRLIHPQGNAAAAELAVFCQALLVSGEFRILN
jgi:hypothetical protein